MAESDDGAWHYEEHDEDEANDDDEEDDEDLEVDDECQKCHETGELVLCDYCPKGYHINCAGLKVSFSNRKRCRR